nr:hypothetical protein [Prevotella sp.]
MMFQCMILSVTKSCDNDDYTGENIRIFDFELSPKDMETISGLNKNQRTYEKNDPDDFPW